MAKYNMLLGTAAGTLGDVVLSRRDGVQQQRVRVRKIANPQTQGQAAQRSYVAPVTKFYSPLSVTLERSWEGKNKAKSYAAYLKYNTDKARQNKWALPKGATWFPLPFRLSHGSITALPQGISFEEGTLSISVAGASVSGAVAESTPALFAKSLIAAGYKQGDQITIIFADRHFADDIYAADNFSPKVIRFFLDAASTATWANLGLTCTASPDHNVWTFEREQCVAAAVIVSRYERGVWKRSTNDLLVSDYIMDVIDSDSSRRANINTYRPVLNAPESDIYLNGSTGASDAEDLITVRFILRTEHQVSISSTSGQSYSGSIGTTGFDFACAAGAIITAQITDGTFDESVWQSSVLESNIVGNPIKFVAVADTITCTPVGS